MKVLIMLNGITHYFNLLMSKVNEQPGIEIIYVFPREKSIAMGEGVLQTKSGANFQLIELDEKMDAKTGSLYYEGLAEVLEEIRPDIIMAAETNIRSLMYDTRLQKIIQGQGIKVILKSIPFKLKKYDEEISDAKKAIKDAPLPPFLSLPAFVRQMFKLLKANVLYKKAFLDKKALQQFITTLDERKKIFNYADAHVNYVEAAYDIYGSYGVPKEKIFVTYNSPDTDFYFSVKEKISKEPPILPPNQFRLIHLSRLVEWKRVETLVTAVANLKQQFSQIELLVVGEGPEKEKLMQQAKDLEVEDRIRFLGGVYDPEMLGKYIMSSGIYVLAGMGGLSINDAMIFGLPVICSVCDGTEKHLVKEGYNGLYFKEGNQESLEQKIGFLLNHPQLVKEMGLNSAQIIEDKINVHTVVERYLNAFASVIEHTREYC
jgi:glycosyltransferase involved in cell wall biosynthesis